MAALASDWLRHFRLLLWNRWTEFNETWQEARSQCPLPSLFFEGPIRNTGWLPQPLIGGVIFDFFSKSVNQNSMKLYKKQNLNILYQVCVFRADQKYRMAAPASYWLRHFRLLLWSCWMEFNETWLEASTQHPLASLSFLGKSLSACVPFKKEVLRSGIFQGILIWVQGPWNWEDPWHFNEIGNFHFYKVVTLDG